MATDFGWTACPKSKDLLVESNFGVTPPFPEELLPMVIPWRYFPSATCNQYPDLETLKNQHPFPRWKRS